MRAGALSADVIRSLLTSFSVLALMLGAGACQDFEQTFTEGRLEHLCDETIPVCAVQAGCVIDDERYVESHFPGGQRLVVRSPYDDLTLVVRILLIEYVYPGTELFIQVYSPTCADFERERLVDVDLFELAGGDRTLQIELPLPERGDHLLELYSDMAARYALTVDMEL